MKSAARAGSASTERRSVRTTAYRAGALSSPMLAIRFITAPMSLPRIRPLMSKKWSKPRGASSCYFCSMAASSALSTLLQNRLSLEAATFALAPLGRPLPSLRSLDSLGALGSLGSLAFSDPLGPSDSIVFFCRVCLDTFCIIVRLASFVFFNTLGPVLALESLCMLCGGSLEEVASCLFANSIKDLFRVLLVRRFLICVTGGPLEAAAASAFAYPWLGSKSTAAARRRPRATMRAANNAALWKSSSLESGIGPSTRP